MTIPKWLLYLLILAMYVLHNDLWLWHDSSLFFGLPVGFTYLSLIHISEPTRQY